MIRSMRLVAALAAIIAGLWGAGQPAFASPQLLERARQLLDVGQARQAYEALSRQEATLAGNEAFDYLYGVAALDSGNIEAAIMSFERVLAVRPNHAGAQMDLARAYFAAGAYDLAEAGFRSLARLSPPPAAQQAIARYLEAIESRKRQATPAWSGTVEAGLGYDDNLTGVPSDFGAAAQQSFGIAGIEATGNSIRRRGAFGKASAAAEYAHPLQGGWGVFGGGEARLRAYPGEADFNSLLGEARAGVSHGNGPTQWKATAGYQRFAQDGAAPGEPRVTNDRNTAYVLGDWRHMWGPKTQVGLSAQVSQVRFPTNTIEDFDQLLVAASWLRSVEAKGVPLVHFAVFATDDRARNALPFSDATKSKNLFGARSYVQYSLSTSLSVFNALGVVGRRDKDAFARSTTVEKGRDWFAEAQLGLHWQFRKRCALRTQWAHTQNRSNIDLYDFRRNEVSTAVRCDLQ